MPETRPDEQFHALHRGPEPLILANAWDALSARLVQEAGARAIATSSAAVAWARGRADGHALAFSTLLEVAKEIVSVVRVPVSVDFEGGYSDDVRTVSDYASALMRAGVVGINLEDGSGSAELCAEKVRAVRAAAERAGVMLFINARIDVYLRQLAAGEAALVETQARMRRYAEAGASGIFVPWVTDAGVIGTLVRSTSLPLNVLARAGVPGLAELTKLGVRRLSAGAGLARAIAQSTQRLAAAFLVSGDSGALAGAAQAEGAQNFNAMFAGAAAEAPRSSPR